MKQDLLLLSPLLSQICLPAPSLCSFVLQLLRKKINNRMSENYYGYVIYTGRIERFLIQISEDQKVVISTTDDRFNGRKENNIIEGDKTKYLILKTESDDSKKKLNIIIKVGDSIQEQILLGIWSGVSENYSLITGRIVLTRVQLKPEGGINVHIEDGREVEELVKREELLSIESIISYLQKGKQPPSRKEIFDLKREIEKVEERFKNRIKELEDKQAEIIKELEESNKKVSSSISDFKNLIRKGRIEEVFDGILFLLEEQENETINEIVILNSRWSFIQKESRLGIMSFEERMLSRNKICVGLLEIIERFENNNG